MQEPTREADMNPLTLLFRLPVMPLRGVLQLAEILHDQAERELREPASVKRQLEQAEQARVAGEISDQELAHIQGEAVGRLLSSPSNQVSPAADAG
jgi:Gas vesicle protein G